MNTGSYIASGVANIFNKKQGRAKAFGRMKSQKFLVEIDPMEEKDFFLKAKTLYDQLKAAQSR
jgi:hypothetical protein